MTNRSGPPGPLEPPTPDDRPLWDALRDAWLAGYRFLPVGTGKPLWEPFGGDVQFAPSSVSSAK